MPFTLDKLKEIRKRLDDGDVLGARKPLNELIDVQQRRWDAYNACNRISTRQRNFQENDDERPISG